MLCRTGDDPNFFTHRHLLSRVVHKNFFRKKIRFSGTPQHRTATTENAFVGFRRERFQRVELVELSGAVPPAVFGNCAKQC